MNVREVFSLHDQPDSRNRIEVGRVGRKIEGLKEVPVELLSVMPGGIVENKDGSLPGGGDT